MTTTSNYARTGISSGGAYTSETLAYYNAVAAAGSDVDAMTLNAVDEFIRSGKRDGWWSLVLDCGLFVGKDLTAALVKLKNASGTPASLTNSNFVAADYSQTLGVGGTSATNKKLGTGLIPSSLSLDVNGMSFGFDQLDITYSSAVGNPGGGSLLMGVNNLSGDSPIMVGQYVIAGAQQAAGPGVGGGKYFGAVSFTPASTGIWSFNGARGAQSTASNVGAVSLSTEVTLFSAIRNGTTYYAAGRVGFYFIGNPMTLAQLNAMGAALQTFKIRIGRQVAGPVGQFFGDSITAGQGTTAAQGDRLNSWSTMTAQGTGLYELNFGAPSSQVTNTTTDSNSALSRYQECAALGGQSAFIMYGTNDLGADGTLNGDSTLSSNYTTNLTTVLNYYKNAGFKVVCVGLPWRTQNTNATKMGLWNAANAAAARNAGVPFVDSANAMNDTGTPANFINADGIHPNNSGHALIAARAIEAYRGRIARYLPLTFGAVPAQSSVDLAVTMYGVNAGSGTAGTKATLVDVTPYTGVAAGLSFSAYVSANDTVQVRCTNSTTGPITPTAGAYFTLTAYV